MERKIIVLLAHFFWISFAVNSQISTFDSTRYSVAELQEDFKYLRTHIQSKGTVIYLYNTKKETDHYFDSLFQCITEPLTAIEFFRFIAPIQAFIKDVHTGISPSAEIRKSFFENPYLLPLDIELLGEKVFIEENFSSNTTLNFKQELTHINGIPMDSIMHACALILPREGYETGYPLNWLNKDFFYYYYFVFGPSERYQLELKTKEGAIQKETVEGLSLQTIWSLIDERHPNPNELNIYSEVNDSLKTVTLTINTFNGGEIKGNHKSSVQKVIREQCAILQTTAYTNLIIDVRNNDGGNSSIAKKVLKYILDTPFEMKRSVRVVKSKAEEDLLKRTRPALYGQFQRGRYRPHKNNFKGDVYVLVDSGSTSAAVVFAATLHRHKRATFIGTEMGGNPIVMGGGLWDNVKDTPNTKLTFMFGDKCSVLNDLELNTGHGLIPDFIVKNNYEDFILNRDAVLVFTRKLIENK